MTKYTITIEGYESGLAKNAVEYVAENNFPEAENVFVEREQEED